MELCHNLSVNVAYQSIPVLHVLVSTVVIVIGKYASIVITSEDIVS